jgi:hypothetical protein
MEPPKALENSVLRSHLFPADPNESPISSEKIMSLCSGCIILALSVCYKLKTGKSTFFNVTPLILMSFKSINFHLSFAIILIASLEFKNLHYDLG